MDHSTNWSTRRMSSNARCYIGVTSDRGDASLIPAAQSLLSLQYILSENVAHSIERSSACCVERAASRVRASGACVRAQGATSGLGNSHPTSIGKGTNQTAGGARPTLIRRRCPRCNLDHDARITPSRSRGAAYCTSCSRVINARYMQRRREKLAALRRAYRDQQNTRATAPRFVARVATVLEHHLHGGQP